MANIKISELEELVNVAEDDYFPIVDTSTSETKKIKVAYVGAGGKSGDTLPIGSISAYSGEEIPSNWLKCNGQAISRTTYADLFSVIGTTYGSGDGSTTFNLPDISERVIVGNAGDGEFSIGNTGGEKEHTLTVAEMPEHRHTQISANSGSSGLTGTTYSGLGWSTGNNEILGNAMQNTGGSQPHNNMQPYIALNYIIKAKQSVGIVGTVTSDINDTNDNAVPNAKTVKNYIDGKREIYSTNEVKTNKVWIDGKPIYRKTIYKIKNELISEANRIPHNINNLEFVTDIRGSILREGNYCNAIPWTTKNEAWHVIIGDIDSEVVTLTIGASTYALLKCIYMTLEYTKTTD